MAQTKNPGENEVTMNYRNLQSAQDEGLIQQTIWLVPTQTIREYIKSEHERINSDLSRTCWAIQHQGKIALFVNDVTNQVATIIN